MSDNVNPSKKRSSFDGPSAAVRIRVYKRDRFQCTYCGAPGTDAELEVDHIIPVSKGGSHHMSNLTTACRACNQKKSDGHMDPMPSYSPQSNDPAVGLFFHRLKNGRIQKQGYVKSVDGETALVQLFSFMDGRPTNIYAIKKALLYSSAFLLYPSSEEMQIAYDRQFQKERQQYMEEARARMRA